jgi:hypothetical protein
MKDLILLLAAEVDVQTAYERYEAVQEGRGDVFLEVLEERLTLLRANPELGRMIEPPIRRLLLIDFPFGIFYEDQPMRLIVVGVMDLRQDPQAIAKRLRPA